MEQTLAKIESTAVAVSIAASLARLFYVWGKRDATGATDDTGSTES